VASDLFLDSCRRLFGVLRDKLLVVPEGSFIEGEAGGSIGKPLSDEETLVIEPLHIAPQNR
jgi:hypothetical protein